MKTIMTCLMLTALALPAHAVGHWTIEETDDCFFVEYSGDASEKLAKRPGAPNPNLPAAPSANAAEEDPATKQAERAAARQRVRDHLRMGREEQSRAK